MTAPVPFFRADGVEFYLGDCREVLPALGISEPAVMVTDPPYEQTSLSWDSWPAGWLSVVPESVRSAWTFGSLRMFVNFGHEFADAGWSMSQDVVWEKHNGSSFHADRFRRVHELAVHWYRGRWSSIEVFPQYVGGATARTVHRKQRPQHMGAVGASSYSSVEGGPKLQRSVIPVRSMHGRAIHPTEKPAGILEPLIRYTTRPGDLVIDPFGGSCSTARAALALGRRAICIEADEAHLVAAVGAMAQGVLPL